MHSIRMIAKGNWEVVLSQSNASPKAIFNMLTFKQAIDLCNFLNGGNAKFDSAGWCYIECCVVK